MNDNYYILPHLIGGLGNQLFIAAATYAIQSVNPDKQIKLLFPQEDVNIHRVSKYDYFTMFFAPLPNAEKIQLPSEILKNLFLFPEFQGPTQKSFDAWNPHAIKIPCILEGYFQYYPSIEPIISQLQTLWRNSLFGNIEEKHQLPNPEQKTIFVHVRRGDYISLQHHHFLQDEYYYKNALQHFDTNTKVYIFSDDIDYCKTLSVFSELPYKEYVIETDEIISLAMMASCSGGAIIANSTFSYWGAMLGAHYHGAKVVAPVRWCADPPCNLFPPNWLIL